MCLLCAVLHCRCRAIQWLSQMLWLCEESSCQAQDEAACKCVCACVRVCAVRACGVGGQSSQSVTQSIKSMESPIRERRKESRG